MESGKSLCIETDRGMNTEEPHLVLKTVCSALFMLFCIDDTVSPEVGRHVFSQPFSLSRPQGE